MDRNSSKGSEAGINRLIVADGSPTEEVMNGPLQKASLGGTRWFGLKYQFKYSDYGFQTGNKKLPHD